MSHANHNLNPAINDSLLPVRARRGGNGGIPTMSSREIADLVGARHDNVRRTIERLAERGVIQLPPMEGVKNHLGQTITEYVFSGERGKRDSIVVVAQLSPEFTARLVDRWQELEVALRSGSIATHRNPRIDVVRENRLTWNLNLKIAKMAGLTGNQALLAANRATVAMIGIDALSLMGVTHLPAPQNDVLLTPTDIGNRLDITARQANVLLCNLGLQLAGRDLKGHVYYEPTEAGLRAGAVMQDTGKRHGSGTPIRQLKWASSVLRLLESEREAA